jgi:hypothetical protein
VRSIVRPAALVQAWLDTLRPDQRETALALNDAALAAEPGLVRSIKWGNLMFLHQGAHAVAVVMHKDHANLQVFNGALLAPEFPMLEGTGKGVRHVKVRYSQPLDVGLVTAVVRACVDQMAPTGR